MRLRTSEPSSWCPFLTNITFLNIIPTRPATSIPPPYMRPLQRDRTALMGLLLTTCAIFLIQHSAYAARDNGGPNAFPFSYTCNSTWPSECVSTIGPDISSDGKQWTVTVSSLCNAPMASIGLKCAEDIRKLQINLCESCASPDSPVGPTESNTPPESRFSPRVPPSCGDWERLSL